MFKAGDIVERTAYCTSGLQVGKRYAVERMVECGDIVVRGNPGTFFARNFKLVGREENDTDDVAPLAIQHGGTHYKKLKIQPVEYIMANGIPYMEGNVIKYCTRWRDKGGIEDLKKAKHYLEILIENEQKNVPTA